MLGNTFRQTSAAPHSGKSKRRFWSKTWAACPATQTPATTPPPQEIEPWMRSVMNTTRPFLLTLIKGVQIRRCCRVVAGTFSIARPVCKSDRRRKFLITQSDSDSIRQPRRWLTQIPPGNVLIRGWLLAMSWCCCCSSWTVNGTTMTATCVCVCVRVL